MDKIIQAVMSRMGFKKSHVEKVKEVLDMIEFKEEDGKKVTYVHVGEGVEVKIVQSEDK